MTSPLMSLPFLSFVQMVKDAEAGAASPQGVLCYVRPGSGGRGPMSTTCLHGACGGEKRAAQSQGPLPGGVEGLLPRAAGMALCSQEGHLGNVGVQGHVVGQNQD